MRWLVSVTVFLAAVAVANAQIAGQNVFPNDGALKSALHFLPYYGIFAQHRPARPLKIAVLDHGFLGYRQAIGTSLPQNTTYHPGPVPLPPDVPEIYHGLAMAEIVSNFLTDAGRVPSTAPELHLYNAFGYSDFKFAVEDAIKRHIDLILYSEVRDYGGNFDGTGFFDALATEAAKAGIIWVNAAGSFAQGVYNKPVALDPLGWIILPDQNDSIELSCDADQFQQPGCQLRLVLSWNDFKDSPDASTNKDLDLYLYDEAGSLVASSKLAQIFDKREPGRKHSQYPRELIETMVPSGHYFVKVFERSHNFTNRDRIRIGASGDFVVLNHADKRENLMILADNPQVITVGAADDLALSSWSVSLGKPELLAPSTIWLGYGQTYKGNSNAAAMILAAIGMLEYDHPDWKQKQQFVSSLRWNHTRYAVLPAP